MIEIDSELVSIPVPKRHLTRVYGFIASLESADGISQESLGLNGDGKKKEWTAELIRRQFLESPDTIKRFEKLLAERAGTWLSTSEIAQALGASHGTKTIAGALGAYGRRVSNRYQMSTWPFETRWIHEEGQQSYCMPSEVAEIIGSL
jgi:hypothetical protein